MDRILFKQYCNYLINVVSKFDKSTIESFVIFYDDYSRSLTNYNKYYESLFQIFRYDLLSIQNGEKNVFNILNIKYSDKNFIFINFLIRGINSFLEIHRDEEYFKKYSKYSNQATYHDFMSLFFHTAFRGGISRSSIPVLKGLFRFCDNNDFISFKLDLASKLEEIYFVENNIQQFELFYQKLESESNRFKAFFEIKHFSKNVSLNYNDSIHISIDKVNKIQNFIESFNNKYSFDLSLTSNYYLQILEIELFYYQDFKLLDRKLDQFMFFLNTNKLAIGKNMFESGLLNFYVHKFLIRHDRIYLDNLLTIYNSSISVSNLRVSLLLQIMSFSLILGDLNNFIFSYSEISKYKDKTFNQSLLNIIDYFYSGYCHHTNDFKNAHLYIQKASKLLSDKSGFGLGIRMLEIMNFIKWEKFEQLDSALINLKNHITLLKKGGKIKPRYIFIYKILLKLHTSGFDYKDTFRLHKDKLRLMNGEDRFYAFDFRGPELIRFDTWFFDQAGFIPDWSLNDFRLQ